jgi:hypothetical protein
MEYQLSGTYRVELKVQHGSYQRHTGATPNIITISDDCSSSFAVHSVDLDLCVEYAVSYTGQKYHIGLRPHYVPGMHLFHGRSTSNGLKNEVTFGDDVEHQIVFKRLDTATLVVLISDDSETGNQQVSLLGSACRLIQAAQNSR